ncbi:D-alanyl-D-alanine carboxypeptidase [Candidatus Uhrbacteria bacterium]|nr:D-alanyl-D-alanine carboxypeptidase [Candidatus Uhrbacteria bacterium]
MVAITMYLAVGSAHPALTVEDFRPAAGRPHLALAVKVERPRAPVKKDPRRLGIDTSARSAVVIDWETGARLFEKNADAPAPIASISKLMTALVVLQTKTDMRGQIQILGSDDRPGGIPYVAPGEWIAVDDLFHLSLVASANNATVALARSTGLSADDFAKKMNDMAAKIGMKSARFVEPTGLDPRNEASAADVAVLVKRALSEPAIKAAVNRESYRFVAKSGREVAVRSTDQLLGSFLSKKPYTFLGGKTGYLQEAGYCLGAAAENGDGRRVVAVALGAPTIDQRFRDVKSLIFWAFDAFAWSQ